MVGLATLLWALIEGPTKGWRSARSLGAFVVGIALLAAFLVWERHTDHPMLDLSFFRNPRFSAASGAITLTFLSLMGMIFVLTQYLQSVLGFSPLKAGAVLMPMSAVMVVLAPMSARFVERFGTKLVLGTGLVIVSLALAIHVLFTTGHTPRAVIGVTMVLAAGMANVMAPGHRVDHGLAAPGEGRRGLGGQRHHPPGRRGAGRGRVRQPHGLPLRQRRSPPTSAGRASPQRALDVISGNVQAGIGVGRDTGGRAGRRIIDASQQAFLSGMHLAVLVAAGITLLAAVGVFLWLPARAPAVDRPVVDVDDADVDDAESTTLTSRPDVDDDTPVGTVPADAVPAPGGVG